MPSQTALPPPVAEPEPMGVLTRSRKLAAAYAWRGLWKADDVIRAALWNDRRGFDLRPRANGAAELPDGGAVIRGLVSPWRAPTPTTDKIGVVDATGVMAEVARFYGLQVHSGGDGALAPMLEQARREGWPVVAADLRSADGSASRWGRAAAAYVESGGTLFLDRAAPGDVALEELATATGKDVPRPVELGEEPSHVLFESARTLLAGPLAGVAMRGHDGGVGLAGGKGGEPVAWLRSGDARYLAVSQLRHGDGRIVLSVGAKRKTSLAEALVPPRPLAALPLMMVLRDAYAELGWRAPRSMATFVIDDPALRGGRLGLDYDRALGQAREHGFHVSVATIPRELEVADARVVELLRASGEWLSACYHGSDHSGYEFFLAEGGRMRYRTRPIADQAASLQRAVERGEAFARDRGLALDRVMVFPHGVATAGLLPALQNLGFVAACNYDDRYPLGSEVPADYDLGLRAADLGWNGFPLIWRRGLPDHLFPLDLFLGRPAITFGHPRALGPDLAPFVDRAAELRRVGDVRWTSLEDIARHSYLERFDPSPDGGGWKVLMLSNEICVHNASQVPRSFQVERPHAPHGFVLDSPIVTVPPGGSRVVRLTAPGARTLQAGTACRFEPGQTPTRGAQSA
jgi:hypothetical protein